MSLRREFSFWRWERMMGGKLHNENVCTIAIDGATHDLIFHRLRRLDSYQHVVAFRRQARQGEKGTRQSALQIWDVHQSWTKCMGNAVKCQTLLFENSPTGHDNLYHSKMTGYGWGVVLLQRVCSPFAWSCICSLHPNHYNSPHRFLVTVDEKSRHRRMERGDT